MSHRAARVAVGIAVVGVGTGIGIGASLALLRWCNAHLSPDAPDASPTANVVAATVPVTPDDAAPNSATRHEAMPPASTPGGIGMVRGRVADLARFTELRRHVGMLAKWQSIRDAENPGTAGGEVAVDADGHFDLRPPSRRLRVWIELVDATGLNRFHVTVAEPLPLLGESDAAATAGELTMPRTGDAELALPLPIVGEVNGRVTAAGEPVANAIVFCLRADVPCIVHSDDFIVLSVFEASPEYLWQPLTSLDVHEGKPHAVTPRDGTFRFLTHTAGPFELRARGATSPLWSEPVRVELPQRGTTVTAAIQIPAGTIRGYVDCGTLDLADRANLRARLLPLAVAGPAAVPSWPILLDQRPPQANKVSLDADAAFAFAQVQAGNYALAIDCRDVEALRLVEVHIDVNQAVDLGRIDPSLPKRIRVQLGSAVSGPIYVQRRFGEHLAFVRWATSDDERCDFGWLEPGSYRAGIAASPFTISDIRSEPPRAPFDFEVRADGTCVPAVAWPSGR